MAESQLQGREQGIAQHDEVKGAPSSFPGCGSSHLRTALQIDIDSLVHDGTVNELFPLHQSTGQQELYECWCSNPRTSPKLRFPPFSFLGDFLQERKSNQFSELTTAYNYLGATHALYFGSANALFCRSLLSRAFCRWISFYSMSLLGLIPFALGLIIHRVSGEASPVQLSLAAD